MQLRYLSALQDIAGDKTSTIVFPVPIDTLKDLIQGFRTSPGGGTA